MIKPHVAAVEDAVKAVQAARGIAEADKKGGMSYRQGGQWGVSVRLPDIWGEATTTCASDSKKFGAWDQNLMTEWHVRYSVGHHDLLAR